MTPNAKNVLHNMHKDFVAVPTDEATSDIDLAFKRFHPSVIAKELELSNNLSADTYNRINNLSANAYNDKYLRDLKIKFNIDNVPFENCWLLDVHWMPKMHKNLTKTRFIIASPICSIKHLAGTKILVIHLVFRQIQTYNGKCNFFL